MAHRYSFRIGKALTAILLPSLLLAQEPVQKPSASEENNGINQTETKSEIERPDKPVVQGAKVPDTSFASTAAVAGGVGAAVAAVITALFGWLGKRVDERNAIRTLAAQLALEQWKTEHTVGLEKHQQDLRARGFPPSLEGYTFPYINPIIKEMAEVIETLAKTK